MTTRPLVRNLSYSASMPLDIRRRQGGGLTPNRFYDGSAVAANNAAFSGFASAGSASYVKRFARRHWTPKNADYSNIQFVVCNWNVNQNGDNITNMGEQKVQIVLVEDPDGTPVKHRVTFNGQNIGVVAVGEYLISDPVPITISADTEFAEWFQFYRSDASVVVPSGVPIRASLGEGAGGGTDEGYDLESATFANVNTEGWASSLILGIPSVPVNSLFIAGDSIARGYGAGDADGVNGNRGIIERAVGGEVGVFNASYPSGLASVWRDDTKFTRVFGLVNDLPSGTLTHAVWGGATNDVAAGIGIGTITTYVEDIFARFRNAGMLATAHTLMPYTTSTDSWVTEINQTPRSQFASGAVADQYNEDLLDGTIVTDYRVLDGRSFLQGTDTNVWEVLAGLTSSTNDGIHPNADGLTQAQADGLNMDWIKEKDPFSSLSLVFDLYPKRDVPTVTGTDVTAGTAQPNIDFGSEAARASKYSNDGSGYLYAPDDSTQIITETAIDPEETRTDVFILEMGDNPVSNVEMISLGITLAGDQQVALYHTSSGSLSYGTNSGAGYPVLAAGDNSNTFTCVVLEYEDAGTVNAYYNGALATTFNPDDDYFAAGNEIYHIFSRFTSLKSPVNMKLHRQLRFNNTLSGAGITAAQIYDYANATFN